MLSSRVQGCCFVIIVFIAQANSDGDALDQRKVASHLGVSTKDRQFRKFFGFLHKYKKKYEDANLKDRYKVFKDNLKKIKLLNKEELGTAVYGITPHTDLTTDEFLNMYGTTFTIKNPPEHIGQSTKNGKSRFRKLTIKKPPKTCDWRNAKPPIVTPIRNQGVCASCWIFATIAVLESQYQLRKRLKKQPHFSEQQILDCGGKNITCNRGRSVKKAISIIKNKLKSKIAARKVYPYLNEEYIHNEDGKGKCVRDRQPNYKFKNLESINLWGYPGREDKSMEYFMARYIAEQGPIAVLILFDWAQHYKNGIMRRLYCSTETDYEKKRRHIVAVVGFGRDKEINLPYWILKNSWGIRDGDENEGYLYIARGEDMCYVSDYPIAVNMSPNIHPRYKKAGCPKHTYLPPNPYKKRKHE